MWPQLRYRATQPWFFPIIFPASAVLCLSWFLQPSCSGFMKPDGLPHPPYSLQLLIFCQKLTHHGGSPLDRVRQSLALGSHTVDFLLTWPALAVIRGLPQSLSAAGARLFPYGSCPTWVLSSGRPYGRRRKCSGRCYLVLVCCWGLNIRCIPGDTWGTQLRFFPVHWAPA